jgi:hypothetical protein
MYDYNSIYASRTSITAAVVIAPAATGAATSITILTR